MEANKFFTREAAASTRKMEHMTEEMNSIAKRTKQQSVSMHVITVVTLLFLPGTFISVSICDPLLLSTFVI
jgi:histone acetyltransferase (RNA polymerase elongator complex component)